MEPIVHVRDLMKTYVSGDTETHALRGVSFEVRKGEFVALMGPSGSGKSTLMNLLGLLDTPTSGSYQLGGVDVHSLGDDALADARSSLIGFVFQSFNLLKRATVMRNVMLPMIYSEVPERERLPRALAALEAAGLESSLHAKRSNQLSGGQMQRVAIARALVNDPALILADEPTGNLDTATGEFILKTFENLRDQGRTIVLITHEADVARHADRTLHIRDGLMYEESDAA